MQKVIIVVGFPANIIRKAIFFTKILREKNFFQIFANPKGKRKRIGGAPKGRTKEYRRGYRRSTERSTGGTLERETGGALKGAPVLAGRISSVVEHFTRNEGVPSSSLGFGSKKTRGRTCVRPLFLCAGSPFFRQHLAACCTLRNFFVTLRCNSERIATDLFSESVSLILIEKSGKFQP